MSENVIENMKAIQYTKNTTKADFTLIPKSSPSNPKENF